MASDNGGPKLYSNKPKKSQLKKAPNPVSTAMDPPQASPVSSTPLSKPFFRKFQFIIPATLAVAVGGYLFLRTNEKPKSEEGEASATSPSTATTTLSPSVPTPTITPATQTATVIEKPITEPVKVREPIPEDQQRELFKWILEEKRKVKPISREEKKRIDEEKAVLKEIIRAKSIPSF